MLQETHPQSTGFRPGAAAPGSECGQELSPQASVSSLAKREPHSTQMAKKKDHEGHSDSFPGW